jgi:predicted ATPase/DNA-binding CsgD family transcriptional regulator
LPERELPQQLLPQPTPLLDRTAELAAIQHFLLGDSVRLVTLTGPAGVGKTRLAREVGVRIGGCFAQGVAFVDLTPTRDAHLVPARIAHALGLPNNGREATLTRLEQYLRERHLLLILDNFEQVISAGGEIAQLLGAAPLLRILVTSRSPLHLRWEHTLRIDPLPVPDLDVLLPLDALLQLPSVALFVERAQAQRADFIPTEGQAPLLIQLIRQLDGLPLAIELAAARMSVLSLGVIAHQLDHLLQTLRWDAQDLPERQRSLTAAIGWSYELLSESERRLFRHLGVFVGRVSLDAIEAVVGERDADEGVTFSGLASLAEKSLVLPRQSDDDDAEPSFGMLETVREYAWEQLRSHDELEAARRAHARYFLDLAERADPQLRRRGQLAWYSRLEAEHDNLQAALRWLLDHDDPELGLRLAAALGYFWWQRGYHAEGWRWLDEALSKTPNADPAIRTSALASAGMILAYRGEFERSQALLDAALDLARASQDRSAIVQSLTYLGARSVFVGAIAESRRQLQEALRYAEELQNDFQIGVALAFLAYLPWIQGDYQEAAALGSAALSRFQAIGDLANASLVQFYLAVALQRTGDLPRAVQLLQEGLQTSMAMQDRWQLSRGVEATLLFVGHGADVDRRARLLGAVDDLVQATGTRSGTLARLTGWSVGSFRSQLEQEGLGAAYRDGRSQSFRDVVTLAVGLLEEFSQTLGSSKTAAGEPNQGSSVSPREHEVLRLVAEGLTSKQIGKQLFLSPRTVDHHLTSIFNKLGVDTRAQAVAVAAREGLI